MRLLLLLSVIIATDALKNGFEGCPRLVAEKPIKGSKKAGKADIIWWIDDSGSMGGETQLLNQNINAFGTFLLQKGIDYRVIMMGDGVGGKLCASPPFGGPSCGNSPDGKYINLREINIFEQGANR